MTAVGHETLASFEGPRGALRVGVAGYQFPQIENDEWDSNWLIITGTVVLEGRSWSFRDPCLTTFEMQRLADWLDQVGAGKAESAFCGFTEPNLDFAQVSPETIRIAFSLEALPPWGRVGDLREIALSIPIDHRLAVAANCLREFLAQFPMRAGNGS